MTHVGAIAVATPSRATDFTAVVPVQLSHIPPDMAYFQVMCQVFSASGEQIASAGADAVPITGGAFSGDVTVSMDASPGRDPATASSYQCNGFFMTLTPPRHNYFDYMSSTHPATFPLQPGAPFVLMTGLQPLH